MKRPHPLRLRFTLRTGYYGLSFNTSQLHADPYISCFMSAAVEIPANVLMWLTLRYLRRRLTVIAILTLAAAALFFIQLVPQGERILLAYVVLCFLWGP